MYRILISLAIVAMIASGCKKEAGEGGTSTITGKVTVRDYNGSFPFFYESLPAQELDVYIIYGDATAGYDNRTRTSYDGTYRFDFLRKGNYKIFVYTDDTVNIFSQAQLPVITDVQIDKNKSTIEVPEVIVVKL